VALETIFAISFPDQQQHVEMIAIEMSLLHSQQDLEKGKRYREQSAN
jgi:uncharacterized protein YqgQ